MWLVLALSVAFAAPMAAERIAADLGDRIRNAGLDPDECYQVREVTLVKGDLRLYLTEGHVVLGKPVDGHRHAAIFSGEIEGGDGEILVMPPMGSERKSLATFTDAPNLNEHFKFALMLFSDDTAEQLLKEIQKQPRVRKSPERGVLLADRWNTVTGNLSRSFGIRLVYDALAGNPGEEGFFYAAIRGSRHGDFDAVFDPVATEQIQVGQISYRNSQAYFDVWTSFPSRAFRNGSREPARSGFSLSDFRIEATLEPDLQLRSTTEASLTVEEHSRRVMYFNISPQMNVSEVEIDGQPCETWQRDALRANLFSGVSGLFLVVAPHELEPGRHTIRFRHEGKVVSEAGNGVYYVGSRASWYPRHGLDFAQYDITFRYPAGMNLVFAGEEIENRSEQEWQVTRKRTEQPVRLVGFNVGRYENVRAERSGLAVEVYANKQVEEALEPERQVVMVPDPRSLRREGNRTAGLYPMALTPTTLDPTKRLGRLAEEVADAFEFFREHLGPPPTPLLMVSPIPGTFGQGFPGLLYVSTMTYLRREERPGAAQNDYQDFFYSEILHAHETAHQWWGNVVTTEGYESNWMMEALANYSALLLLEKKKGTETLDQVLGHYRGHLLAKNDEGKTLESAGPITWGPRLDSSQSSSYRVITYEKGSWIMHMLRRRLGNDAFMKMLSEICRVYRYKNFSVDDLRVLAASYTPEGLPDRKLENFFDQWVYDTGIPNLDFDYRLRGKAPRVRITGSVTQSGVPDYFSTLVPIEIHLPGETTITRWLRTSEEPVSFDITVRERPLKVVFNPGNSTLAVR